MTNDTHRDCTHKLVKKLQTLQQHIKTQHPTSLVILKLSSKYFYILMYSCAETIQHQKHLYGPAVEVENTQLTSPHEKTKPKSKTEKNTENGKTKDIFVLLC